MNNDILLALAKDLVNALEKKGDKTTIGSLLGEIAGLREAQLFQEVGRLTRQLHDTMDSFTVESKIVEMTEQAANQTSNAVENLLPVSEQLNDQATILEDKWNAKSYSRCAFSRSHQ